ncbi:MAG: sialidase family protein [Paraglaciecola sp.]|uniref:sialidase family protein n=1 Tax=Paraglaciecola sp. TaxID=1920173 RepID=UPI00329A08A8
MPKYKALGNIVLVFTSMVIVMAAEAKQLAPFYLKNNKLFDFTQPATLGLHFAKNVETFDVFKATPDTKKYNHGAVLLPFKGKLFIQWQSSAVDEDANDTAIVFSISENGKDWGPVNSLVSARENAIVTNGGWWSDGNELIAFINVWPKSLKPKEGYVEYIRSQDGQHWSQPQRLKHASGENVAGVIEQDLRQLPKGRILTTIHAQPGLIATPYYTDDPLAISGWQAGKMQNLPHQGQVSRELEPSWFIKKDQSIVMVFRDQASSFKVLASQSVDNAENWTTPVETNMPDSRAKQSAGNLPDGSAFLVNNPSGSKTRIPLTVTLSDDGKVFDRAFLLRAGDSDLPEQQFQGKYKRAGFSYPKSIVWQGFIYVSYAVNKEDIAVTRVPVSALVSD